MADVASALYNWSTTASSNSPGGTTSIGTGLDDNLREIQAAVRAYLAHYNSSAIASAGTTNLGANTGNIQEISGTTTITSFGTVSAGIWKIVRFQGALTLTHNATSLVLPGAANITTAAGDFMLAYSKGSGNWVVPFYQKTTDPFFTPSAGTAGNAMIDTGSTFLSTPLPNNPINLSLAASVGSNALTISLKGRNGSDPSSTNPVIIPFRSATESTGDYTHIAVTSATSLVVSSGSTLGTASGVPHRLWIMALNDSGTVRLAVLNTQASNGIARISDDTLVSAQAEGGAGGADSTVTYAAAATTDSPCRILGYIESTQATAGTWVTSPSKIQLWTPGMKLPGDVIQIRRTSSGAVATSTTQIPLDDTVPTSSEGDNILSLSISPTSSINRLRVRAQAQVAASASANIMMTLTRDNGSALVTSRVTVTDPSYGETLTLLSDEQALSTSSTTYRLRIGPASAVTVTINGNSGSRLFGGTANSYLEAEEIMA